MTMRIQIFTWCSKHASAIHAGGKSILNRMINEVYNSYKIEGEIVPTEDIMSSISNRLHPERSQQCSRR